MSLEILVVDDSALLRRVECDIINSDNKFKVTDTCKDGLEALEKLRTKKYDGVVLDINMPRMDGLELLQQLQKEKIKANIVMASTLTVEGANEAIKSLELGAIDFVTKPSNIIEAKGDAFKKALLDVLYAATKARVHFKKPSPVVAADKTAAASVNRLKKPGQNKIIAIASSTGGPKALQSVIPRIPADIDAPVVLVQHMPAGFTRSMAARLNELSKVQVKEAEDGELLKKGVVYIAPGGKHIVVKEKVPHMLLAIATCHLSEDSSRVRILCLIRWARRALMRQCALCSLVWALMEQTVYYHLARKNPYM